MSIPAPFTLHTLLPVGNLQRQRHRQQCSAAGDEHLQLAFPFLQELTHFKEQNVIKALLDGPVTSVTAGKTSRKRRVPGPSAEPCTAARKQAPSAATHCKHSGPLLLGGGKITAVPSGCCSSGLQPPHKHQASVLLGAESDCVHEVHPLGWLKQTNLRIYSNSMFGFRKTTLRLEDSLEGLGTQKSC